MKKIGFIACVLMAGSFWACNNAPKDVAILKGKVDNYKNEGYLLLIGEKDGKSAYDTIQVQTDGSFTFEVKGPQSSERGLYFEYLGDDRSVINCYMIPGETTEVTVTGGMQNVTFFGETTRRYVSTPTFSGVTKKECEYLNIPPFYDYVFRNEDGSPVTFKNYLNQIEEQQNFLREKLKGTCAEFAKEKNEEIDAMPASKKFVYAWRLKRDGNNASQDTDFMNYVNSIDVNDTANIAGRGQFTVTGDYVRFNLMIHPELYKGESEDVRTFCYIRDNITNPKVREFLADYQMEMMMAMGGNENLIPAFAVYKEISNNNETFKRNEATFNSLAKLLPGVKASDFEMQDVKGKKLHFHDVIGKEKVTYIDFWATWCGPCCAEIPYVEKLVEKYKNNPNIEFISISLDNDLNKWHKKLEKDQPLWRQYVIPDNFNSTFAKEYNIRAIPRFMVFDKEGKIININAERPSDPNIDNILKEYINKK